MSTSQIRKRVEKVEAALCPNLPPRTYTLETLCRQLWLEDKEMYLKMVAEGDPTTRFFRQQFEREDAELEESQS